MKIGRDYLKKIISEEIKKVIKEEAEETVSFDAETFTSNPKMIGYARLLKQVVDSLGKDYINNKDLKAEAVASILELKGYEDLTPKEKVDAMFLVFGPSMSKWPQSFREYASGTLGAGTRDEAGSNLMGSPSQPQSVVLSGTKGVKCKTAAVIQQEAVKTIGRLATKLGIEPEYLQKLKGRLSDGIMGNTTLGIMIALSNGRMTPAEYPLNNLKGFKKACNVNQELVSSIINAMNVDVGAKKMLDAVGGTETGIAESKNVAFRKALRTAILKELQKNS